MPDYLDLFQDDAKPTPAKTSIDRVREAEKAARKKRRAARAAELSRRNTAALEAAKRSESRRRHIGRP